MKKRILVVFILLQMLCSAEVEVAQSRETTYDPPIAGLWDTRIEYFENGIKVRELYSSPVNRARTISITYHPNGKWKEYTETENYLVISHQEYDPDGLLIDYEIAERQYVITERYNWLIGIVILVWLFSMAYRKKSNKA